jgi:hypothetical protein
MRALIPVSGTTANEQAPKDRHVRILQALAEASESLSTIALSHQTGRTRAEVSSACAWLRNRGFIARELRRIRRQAFGSSMTQLMGFWFLTEKGAAFLGER